jgi:hypothetical protein
MKLAAHAVVALLAVVAVVAPREALAQAQPQQPQPAAAAAPAPAGEAPVQMTPELMIRIDQAHSLRNAGIALTFVGLGVTFFGSAAAVAGAANFMMGLLIDWDSLGTWGSIYVAGIVFAIAGAAMMAAGIPLWAVGATRERRLSRGLQARVLPALGWDPARGVATAGVSFTF